MEKEPRGFVTSATDKAPSTGKEFVDAIRARFEPYGGVELEIPPRGPMRQPIK